MSGSRFYNGLLLFSALFLVLVISGCAPQRTTWPKDVVSVHGVAGFSVEKRPIAYTAAGDGNDVIFIVSGIHGDEPASKLLVDSLISHLQQHPVVLKSKKVILLPAANPDGLVAKTRFNKNGVDINRNFDASNRVDSNEFGVSGLSEPESQAIRDIIWLYRPQRIVSVHEPYGCIDFDGPADELAKVMATKCDLKVEKVGARPGSLGSYAGINLGIPIITLELGKTDYKLNSQRLWKKYGQSLIAAIGYSDGAK